MVYSSSDHPTASSSELSLREIPGTYGKPFFGPIKDRYDYFYNQGKDEFFTSRIKKYNSTVFRTNMPPGPFISSNSKVVAVLDSKSFTILFDNSKVEKKNILDGTYMPSLSFFGGYRPCAFLDTNESNHHALKSFFISFIASSHKKFIPYLRMSLSELFENLETDISDKKSADFNTLSDNMAFDFMFKLVTGVNPSETKLKAKGPTTSNIWLALQLAPLGTSGLKFIPNFIDDIIHTVKLPFFIIKSGYKKLYNSIYDSATALLDEAEKSGINREEACHNLVFLAVFNAFGGMKILFPSLIKWISSGGKSLHDRLAEEIRTVVKEEGDVTFSALEKMTLTKSAVYEALRIDPPVPFQYATAREDLVIESHDSKFEIKKGETIFGYQPLATKDPKVFDNPEEYVADRFVGEGEKLIKYVYWSNARETDTPSPDNKQCPAKDLVVLCSRMMLVELFLRYDTFTAEVGQVALGASVKITSFTKATC
ncbi:allene oxide synthase 3-like [Rutidosis leptorrhynchoides]|uniref:allene oxide synthase 3-like n=1 Tax=Rutidosis leptorrhynchoides TaxID=125765 RepID=UPI003A99DA67